MESHELFLIEHARAHTAALTPAGGPLWLEDGVMGGLTESQLRQRPPNGGNSLVWLLWHMTRIEDVAVNILLAGQPQVLDQKDWLTRLQVAQRDVGSGMADEEVSAVSAGIDIAALRAYRAAVGRQTRAVVTDMGPAGWQGMVMAADVERAAAAAAFGARAAWLKSFWEGRPRAWVLSWTAAGHCYLHFGEALALRGQLGMSLG